MKTYIYYADFFFKYSHLLSRQNQKTEKTIRKNKLNNSSLSYYARRFFVCLIFGLWYSLKHKRYLRDGPNKNKTLYFAVNLNEVAKKQSIMQTSLSNTAVYYQEVHLYY